MRKLILALLLTIPIFATAQIKVGGGFVKNSPSDNSVTGYGHLINGVEIPYATKASLDSILTDFTAIKRDRMTAYVTATDSTYRLINNEWIAIAPGNITQALANILPAAEEGQVLRGVGNNTNTYEASNLIDVGNYVNTSWDLERALAQPTPTQDQIFQTWRRFAHGGRSNNPTSQQLNDTIPSNPSQTQSWSYDSVAKKAISTFNSGPSMGYTSPNKYTEYTLKATLKSTDTDNDRIGVVGAYIDDYNDMVRNNAYGLDSALYTGINTVDSLIPNQHTFGMYINRDTMVPKYALWYDYGKLSRQLIYDGSTMSGLWNTDNGWNLATDGVDVQVIRRGDSLYFSRSQFSDAPSGKGALRFEIGISLTQNPVLYKFRSGASYGFAVNSQPLASFENITFTGGSSGNIYDIANNVVYIPNGTGGYKIDTTTTAKTKIKKGRLLYNPITKRQFYKEDDFLEIKPTNNNYVDVDLEFGGIADGVTDNTNRINAAAEYAYQTKKSKVILRGGDYLVRKQTDTARTIIQLKSGLTLTGASMEATRIINDPTTPPQIDSIRYGTQIIRTGEILNSAKNITVENLTLIGNSSVINAGQASASPIRGIGNVIQSTNTIPDTAALYKSHIDNVTIRKVAIYDTYNAIMNGRSILRPTGGGGGGGGTPFMRSTDSTYFHRNWLISDVYVNGVGNRAIELSDTKDSRIENSRFFGAGFIHLLRYDFNITIDGNYMSVGADAYTNDRQGYTTSATQEAGGIYLNYGLHDIDIRNNIIEMNPKLNPAIVAAAPFFIRYESGIGADYPQTTRIRSNGNIYRNTISAHKQAIRIVSPTTSIIKLTDFSFTNDIFEGVVRLRGAASDTAITVRNWTFSNSKIDSVIFVTKASTRNSGGFTFNNGTEFKKSFSISASNVNISNSKVNGTTTIASSADSLRLDDFRYTGLSINSATPTPMLVNMPYLSSTATNANYIIQYANQIVNLPIITNNRTVTPTTSTIYTGQTLIIKNGNTSAFTWSFAVGTVTTADGTAVTSIRNNATYTLVCTSTGAWNLIAIADGTVSGTGIPVFTTSPTLITPSLGTPSSLTLTNATGLATAGLVNNAVTYAKMQALSTTSKLLGSSSTTTPVQEITIGSGLTLTGNTLTASGGGGGSVTNVTSANTDITVATGTTTPVLTLNSGGAASQIVKRDANADIDINGITAGRGVGSVANNVMFSAGLNTTSVGTFNIIFGRLNFTNPLTTGTQNTGVGSTVFRYLTSGFGNTAMGLNSSSAMTTGYANSSYGNSALYKTTSGFGNTAMGQTSLYENLIGNYNTAVGHSAGYTSTGNNNVFIGYQAGYNETGDNKLYISNSNTSTPLIKGDFTAGTIDLNATSVNLGASTNLKWISGVDSYTLVPAYYSGNITQYTTAYSGALLPYTGSLGVPNSGKTVMFSKINSGFTLEVANVINTTGYTVSTLPTGTIGDMAYVTDALAPSYMVAVVGGGAVVTPVFYNGVNWVAH